MLALIKYENAELVTFKMKTIKGEKKYCRNFRKASEDTTLILGRLGNIKKRDVMALHVVASVEEAKEYHKGMVNMMKKIAERVADPEESK